MRDVRRSFEASELGADLPGVSGDISSQPILFGPEDIEAGNVVKNRLTGQYAVVIGFNRLYDRVCLGWPLRVEKLSEQVYISEGQPVSAKERLAMEKKFGHSWE